MLLAAVLVGLVGGIAAQGEVGDTQVLVLLVGLSFLAPIAYGLLSRRGRTLGCLVAGTAFFQIGRTYRATWGGTVRTVLLRWWLPVLAVGIVLAFFSSGTGGSAWESAHESRRVRWPGSAPAPPR